VGGRPLDDGAPHPLLLLDGALLGAELLAELFGAEDPLLLEPLLFLLPAYMTLLGDFTNSTESTSS
jgi:hypothetical protein